MCGAVPVKEIYFVAPKSDQLGASYFYYMTSNATSARHRQPTGVSADARGSASAAAADLRDADDDQLLGGPLYSSNTDTLSHVRQLTVTESLPSPLHCVAVGGYPAPRLRMFLGDRDVTERFRRKSTSVLRGIVGMRVIDIRSVLYSSKWTAEAVDDDVTLRCTAHVDRRIGEQFAAVRIYVRRAYHKHAHTHARTMDAESRRDQSIVCLIN